MKEEISKKGRW